MALADGDGRIVATLAVEDLYSYDKEREAREVFRTTDEEHPGVAALYRQEDVLVGGEVTLLEDEPNPGRSPATTTSRRSCGPLFAEKGWKRVVGFQTRNPVHRAHEYIQKSALENRGRPFAEPARRRDQVRRHLGGGPDEVLRDILDRYYPQDRTTLAVFPAAMRYAGPREAIFHAICRKNYGCTHFIVGRDHAGVGSYYGTYDAQHIFEEFEPEELGITPLMFEHSFFCLNCEGMATTKTCPARQGRPRLSLRHQSAGDALQGRVSSAGVLPSGGREGAHRRAPGRREDPQAAPGLRRKVV